MEALILVDLSVKLVAVDKYYCYQIEYIMDVSAVGITRGGGRKAIPAQILLFV